MVTCPFNRGFSQEKCSREEQNLDSLLGHVRKEHGAVAWTLGTLRAALDAVLEGENDGDR